MRSLRRSHFPSVLVTYRPLLISCLILVFIIVLDLFFLFQFQSADAQEEAKKEQSKVVALAERIEEACQKDSSKGNCYTDMFMKIGKDYDLSLSLKILKELGTDRGRLRDCHVIAHKLMIEEVRKQPQKWEELLKIVDPNICNYGFIHGIIEGKTQVDPTFELSPATIPSFCAAMLEKKAERGVDQTCSHIVGHVLLVQTKGDVDKAIKICLGIPLTLQKECASGIFMENFTRENLVAHGIAEAVPWDDVTISTTEELCNQYEKEIAAGCWQEISHLYNHRAQKDSKLVLKDCMKAPQMALRQSCYLHSVATAIQNPQATKDYYNKLCSVFDDRSFETQCHYTAVKALLNSSVQPSKNAITYCSSLSSEAEECFRIIHYYLNERLSKDLLTDYCSNADRRYRQLCTGEEIE